MLTTLRNQHYYPHQATSNIHGLCGYPGPLTPRERYLTSLAEAEAAEAEFIASEAERFQRDEEELLLRRRLEEIQAEKRFSHHYSRGNSFDNYTLRHRHSRHFEDFEPTPSRPSYSSHDRLAVLRRELEEEELRFARWRNQERQREAVRAKELREAERLALLRKAEEDRLKLIREEEERRFLQIRLTQQRLAERRRTVVPVHQAPRCPTVRFATDPTPKDSRYRECSKRASCVPTNNRDKMKVAQEVLQLLLRSGELDASVPQEKKAKEETQDSASTESTEEFLRFLLGHPHMERTVPHVAGSSASKVAKQQEPSKPAENVSKTASVDPSVKSAEEFWKTLFGYEADPASARAGNHVATPQNFLKMVFDVPSTPEQNSSAAESSSTAKVPQEQPTSSTTPNRPVSPFTNLKGQLESRLNNDKAVEIRDTIQAILASLADTATYNTEAVPTGSGSSKPASSTSASPSGDSKGKAKAEAPSTSPAEPTSNDVVKSMETVHTIETAFSALQQDFVFPSQLDFTPTPSAVPSPVSSDTESSTPSITKLAYTSRNHPVRYYEQSLSGLLTQLDGVESFGNAEVRTMRKEVVARVEGALDELEREVEGRWKARSAKQEKDKSGSEVAVNGGVTTSEARDENPVNAGTVEDSHAPGSLELLVEEKVALEDRHATVGEDKESEVTSVGINLVDSDHHMGGSQPRSQSEEERELSVEVSKERKDPVVAQTSFEHQDTTEVQIREAEMDVSSVAHHDMTDNSLSGYSPSSSTLDTGVPLSSPPAKSYPPSSGGDTSTSSSTTASVATIRPHDLDIETASTSSLEEDEDGELDRNVESDSDGFLLSEATPEEKKDSRVSVQEEVGSDWSEVEA